MSLLHATWLTQSKESPSDNSPVLFLWADTWQVVTPKIPKTNPCAHPYSLSSKELKIWLEKKNILPKEIIGGTACLTLPSKSCIQTRKTNNKKNQSAALSDDCSADDEIARRENPKTNVTTTTLLQTTKSTTR